ncbi:MAG: hypothetical protein ACI9VM_000319 [Candidatus Azotimanducaceae bacterium]|jgi:hypothetical protein
MPRATTEKRATKKASTTTRAKSTATNTAKKTVRKAPTRANISSDSEQKPLPKMLWALIGGFIVIGGVSFAIGTSDKGPINVATTISQRAAVLEARGDTEGSAATKAVQAGASTKITLPAGLTGRGNKDTQQQKLEKEAADALRAEATPGEEIASSTDMASSTEAVAESESEEETTEEDELKAETLETNAEENDQEAKISEKLEEVTNAEENVSTE